MKPARPLRVAGSTAAWPGLARSRAALSGNWPAALSLTTPSAGKCTWPLSPLHFQCAQKKPLFQRRGRARTGVFTPRDSTKSSHTTAPGEKGPHRRCQSSQRGQPSRPLHPGPCLVSERFSTLTPFKRTTAEMKYTKAEYTAIIAGST